MDWTTAQWARRDCFHDAAWAEYFTQPRIPEGAVHLIIGDSLIRVLTRIQSHWQMLASLGDVRHGEDVHGHFDDGEQ